LLYPLSFGGRLDRAAGVRLLVGLLDLASLQDRAVCERAQRGLSSKGFV